MKVKYSTSIHRFNIDVTYSNKLEMNTFSNLLSKDKSILCIIYTDEIISYENHPLGIGALAIWYGSDSCWCTFRRSPGSMKLCKKI